MSKRTFLFAAAFAIALILPGAEPSKRVSKPKDGFVPDAKTAIKIAVAVWEPIYSEGKIADEKPYQARLASNGVWVVEGTFHSGWLNSNAAPSPKLPKRKGESCE